MNLYALSLVEVWPEDGFMYGVLDSLSDFKKQTEENRMPVLPVSMIEFGRYFCHFLRLPVGVYEFIAPKKILSAENWFSYVIDDNEEYAPEEKYGLIAKTLEREIEAKIGRNTQKCYVVINLSTSDLGDFCVLLNDPSIISAEDIDKLFEHVCNRFANENSDVIKEDPVRKLMQARSRYIGRRFNPRDGEYGHVISNLCDLYGMGSPMEYQRRCQCAVLAAMILRMESSETAQRFIYNNGNSIDEEAENTELYGKMTDQLFSCLYKLQHQISPNSRENEQVWMNWYALQFLFDIFTSSDMLGELNMNCSGLYPIISPISSVNSVYPVFYTPVLPFGFVYLPENQYSFWKYFPALIHEIHHYIPPLNRKERNQFVIGCIVNSVMQKGIRNDGIFGDSSNTSDYYAFYSRVYNLVYEVYITYYSSARADNVCDEPSQGKLFTDDTMILPEILRDFIEYLDFKSVCLKCGGDTTIPWFIDIDRCAEDWRAHAKSYMHTFVSLLREIRSDLCMTELLEMDLRNYIELMVPQRTLHFLSKEHVAHSVILRIVIVSKYLYAKENKASDPTLNGWYDSCTNILSGYDKNDVNNFREYLEEYQCQQNDAIVEFPHFEDFLLYGIDGLFLGMDDTEGEMWKSRSISQRDLGEVYCLDRCSSSVSWLTLIEKFKKMPYWQAFQECYKKYHSKETDIFEKNVIDFRTRVIFRDLFNWFELDEW